LRFAFHQILMKNRIKVLIVDDAVVVRILLGNAISNDPDLELVGKAQDGKGGLDMISELQPDVVVLDLEMPEMDGLEVLKALKARNLPTKVVMFSTYTTIGAKLTFEALELGALDFVPKPSHTGFSKGFEEVREELLSKIKFIGSARPSQPVEKLRGRVSAPRIVPTSYELIVFEGGMGAPRTFMGMIPEIPAEITPGILIFQSMFSGFAEHFVRRLAKNAQIQIKAAQNDDIVKSGCGFVVFGDYYVSLTRSGTALQLAFRQKDDKGKYGTVQRILFESIAKTCGNKAIGVILAGAGEGNIVGIQAMKDQGALIIAEEPSTIMARKILEQLLEKDLIDESVPTHEIPATLKRFLGLH
jgi:two-component system chemotaxis response regulator CheB